MAPVQLEPLFQMPTAWSGTADRFGLHLFEGRLTTADMDRIEAIGARWHRKHPGRTVELVVVFPSESHMTGAERTRMVTLIKRWQHERVASATVILADGMLGALQRSVLTGLTLLAPPPHPAKVFGKIADGVGWLAPHIEVACGASATRARIQAAVDTFCDDFRARSERGPMG